MNTYIVNIPFDNFQIGDVITLNTHQAKYKLMTGHIIAKPDEISVHDDIPELEALEGVSEEDLEFVKQHPHVTGKKAKAAKKDAQK